MSYNVNDLGFYNIKGRKGKTRYKRAYLFLFLSLFLFSSLYVDGQKEAGCKICPDGLTLGPNLIPNGDFEAGTGTYTIPAGPNTPTLNCIAPFNWGEYCITDNPNALNSTMITSAETGGHGKFLACDAYDKKKTLLFESNLSMLPNSNYVFCAWFTNIWRHSGTDPKVSFYINNSTTPAASITLLYTNTDWKPLSVLWSTGTSNTTVNLKIMLEAQPTGAGNDIGMDNLSFSRCEKIAPCSCGTWVSTTVSWTNPCDSVSPLVLKGCDSTIKKLCCVCICYPVNLTFNYKCEPYSCPTTYAWKVSGPNGFTKNGTNNPCQFKPTMPGDYKINVTPFCGGKECPPCTIKLRVIGLIDCEDYYSTQPESADIN